MSTYKCTFQIDGMHCAACELLIEKKVSRIDHVKHANAILKSNKVILELDKPVDKKKLRNQINALISKDGYEVVDKIERKEINWAQLSIALAVALIFAVIYLALQKLGFTKSPDVSEVNYGAILFIGLVASISSCMAVVGGLVLTLSANYAKEERRRTIPLAVFHISRLISFFILGGLIGWLGSALAINPTIYFIMNIILFVVMVITALNLLDIFPIFRKLQLTMPKFIGSKAFHTGHHVSGTLGPIVLGVITFFLPCGFTQSMQIYALTTGSFISGALTMLVFAIGTLPMLALISFASVKFADSLKNKIFFQSAGFIVLFFALLNFYGALVAYGVINPLWEL